MQLVAEGRLDLHADVNRYLHDFQIPAAFGVPITLDALLTHSSGLDDHLLGGLAADKDHLVPLGRYLATHLPSRIFPPGERILYSNHAMALAGYIVEQVSGEEFATYAERHILTPLKMTKSTFSQPPSPRISEHLVINPRGTPPLLNPYPAGSLVATPDDMGRFIADQLGADPPGSKPVISSEGQATMHAQHFTPLPGMPGAAYGFLEGEANGHRTLHHSGDGGDHSLIELIPDAGLGFYLVYNTPSKADPSTLREQITRDLVDHYLPPPKKFQQPPPPADFAQRAQRYVGVYQIDQYAHATIEKLAALGQEIVVTNPGDGSLRADLGGGPIRLVETQANVFRDPDGAYIGFHSDREGRIVALSFDGATVDDPGSAHRIQWWETSRTTLLVVAALALLLLARVTSGLVMRVVNWRRAAIRVQSLAWRLSGWLCIAVGAALMLAVSSIIASRPPITDFPLGVTAALILVNVVAVGVFFLVPLTVLAVISRRGPLWQRVLLVPFACAAFAALPVLNYWNLLGLRI